jgi:hypothetical protein
MTPRKRAPTIPVVVWWTLAAALPEADALAEDPEVLEAPPFLVDEARVEEAFRLWVETVVPLDELPPATAVLSPAEGRTAPAGAVLTAESEVTVVALTMGTGMRVERAEEAATGETSALDSTAEEMEEATTPDATALETEAAALGTADATTEGAASVTGA